MIFKHSLHVNRDRIPPRGFEGIVRPVVSNRYFKAVIEHFKLTVVTCRIGIFVHIYIVNFLFKTMIDSVPLHKVLRARYKIERRIK
jgi:hypothetical protein